MKRQIRFPLPEETKKRRMIAMAERLIVEAQDYLVTHPSASMVLAELERLRADLTKLRAELADLKGKAATGR
jgi:hypothetical protein